METIKKLNILSIDCDWIISLKQQEELLSFIIPLLYTHTNVTTSLVHHTMYPMFEHGYDEYNLINIDHHHDFSYKPELDNKLNEGNWLFHLSNVFKKKINYLWINNPNSQHVLINRLENLKSYYFDHNLSHIKNKKFDKIFICCSPDYALASEAIIAFKVIERIVNDKNNK